MNEFEIINKNKTVASLMNFSENVQLKESE